MSRHRAISYRPVTCTKLLLGNLETGRHAGGYPYADQAHRRARDDSDRAGLRRQRVLWLTNLIRSGQKTSDEHGRKDNLGTRITTQIKEVFGQTRLLKMVDPRPGPLLHHVGLLHPRHGLSRGVRLAVRPQLPHPDRRPLGRARASCRTSSPSPCCSASPRSRSSGCGPSPRNMAANPGSTARTPAAPG